MTTHRGHMRSIVSSAIAILLFWASLYMYVPILPTHARSSGASEEQIGLILGAYGLTQLFLRLPVGLLSDRLRRKKIFALIGVLLVAASGMGLAFAKTPTMLFVFRALSGGAAAAWVTIAVLYNSHFDIEQAVRTAGQLNLLSAIGQILAMSTGGLIADRWGAHAAFWASAILAVPAFLAFSIVQDVRETQGSGISLRQFTRAISTPKLLLVSGLAACSQYALFATSLGFATVHAQDLGASDAQLGFLTTTVQIAKAIPMLALSVRQRSQDNYIEIVAGMALIAIPLFAFPFITQFPWLIACQAIIGLGIGLVFPVLMGLALQAVEPSARATAMGVYQSVYALGMTLGPMLSGLFARRWGIPGVYLSNGLLLILATAVAALTLRARPEPAAQPAQEPS